MTENVNCFLCVLLGREQENKRGERSNVRNHSTTGVSGRWHSTNIN